jgi:hypothetical protein
MSKDGKAIHMSLDFDIEIAGKAVGVIQKSAEIFWVKIAQGGKLGRTVSRKSSAPQQYSIHMFACC